jgi:hypothetical protein
MPSSQTALPLAAVHGFGVLLATLGATLAVLLFAAFAPIGSLAYAVEGYPRENLPDLQQDVRLDHGGDFFDFYVAGQDRIAGLDPYARPLFNKPPLVALLGEVSSVLPIRAAALVWQATEAATILAFAIAACRRLGAGRLATGVTLAITGLSYPFWFLVERGNLDGFVFALAGLSFVLAARRRAILAGVAMAVAANLKPNVLVLAPTLFLVLERPVATRTAAAGVLSFLAIALVTPRASLRFVGVLATRIDAPIDPLENGSLARLVLGLPHAGTIGFVAFLACAATTYLLVLRARRALDPLSAMLLSLPLCAAWPALAYLYAYVSLPLLLPIFARGSRLVRWLGCLGLVIALLPIEMLAQRLGSREAVHRLPSLGLALVLATNLLVLERSATAPT